MYCYADDLLGWMTVFGLVWGIVLMQWRGTLCMLRDCDAHVISEEIIQTETGFIAITVKKSRDNQQ